MGDLFLFVFVGDRTDFVLSIAVFTSDVKGLVADLAEGMFETELFTELLIWSIIDGLLLEPEKMC
jgi:hypothetical protein